MNKLLAIQTELKAPKSQFNSFGKYNYRNCEDILEALKPLLKKHEATFYLTDEIVSVGNRIYVKATATLIDGDIVTHVSGFAREDESKKGMDACQVSGAASSYARKYALNALFLIDDTKDSDSTNEHGKGEQTHTEPNKATSRPVEREQEQGEPNTLIEKLAAVKPTKSSMFFQLEFANTVRMGCTAGIAALANKALEADHKVSVEWIQDGPYKKCLTLVEVLPETDVPF